MRRVLPARVRSLIVLTGLLVVALPITAPASATERAKPTLTPATAPISDPGTTERIAGEIAAEAEGLGALGAYWDAATEELVLVLERSGSEISPRWFAGRGVSVRTQTASVTRADVESAQAAVVALVESKRLLGESTTVGLDVRSGNIEIASTAEQGVFTDALATLDSPWVFQRAEGRIERLSNRFDDQAPFWGGGWIRHYNGHGYDNCTSGFSVLKNGTPYMLTAGHCHALNHSIFDGNSSSRIGTIRFEAVYPQRDIALIGDKQYGGHIWRSTSLYGLQYGAVVSAGDPLVGASYCSGGAQTYEKCSLVVLRANITGCDEDGNCTGKVAEFNGDQWNEGDSGGPVYGKYASNTNVNARGIILFTFNEKSYAQEWGAIQTTMGVTICVVTNC